MTEKQFYKKWDIRNHNKPYYKKIFPNFVINNEIDYTLLDNEFERRKALKNKARDVLADARGLDIYSCFTQPYAKEKACNWLSKLYMEPICEKHDKKLVSEKTIKKIEQVLKYYQEGKTMIQKINENNNIFEDNIAFIHEYDFSKANSSHESRLNAVTSIASICYMSPDKIGSQGLYDRLANEDIGIPSSSFAFIPVLLDEISCDLLASYNISGSDDTSKFGEVVTYNNKEYLLTNLRALLQDLGWTTDFQLAQKLSEDFFNTDPLEQAIIKKFYKVYKVKIDIATSKQWNRHWFHLQELSRRYVSGKKVPFEFYMDEKLKRVESYLFQSIHYDGQIDNLKTQDVINICVNHYYKALEEGVAPQNARRILPQGAYTEIWTGMTPRVYDNMLKLRTKPKTQWEFRQLAMQIAEWDNWKEQ